MRNQKLLLGLLIVLFAGLCLVMLVFSGGIYALGWLAALIPTLALPSAPFCVLQLALCKYCKGKLLPKLPILATLLGVVASLGYMVESSNIEALAGFLVLVPSLLCLVGCGMGWLIWRFSQTHLR